MPGNKGKQPRAAVDQSLGKNPSTPPKEGVPKKGTVPRTRLYKIAGLANSSGSKTYTPQVKANRKTMRRDWQPIRTAFILTHGLPEKAPTTRRNTDWIVRLYRFLLRVLAEGPAAVSEYCFHWRQASLEGRNPKHNAYILRDKEPGDLFAASTLKRALRWSVGKSRIAEAERQAEERWLTPSTPLSAELKKDIDRFFDGLRAPALHWTSEPTYPIPSNHSCLEKTRREGGVAAALREGEDQMPADTRKVYTRASLYLPQAAYLKGGVGEGTPLGVKLAEKSAKLGLFYFPLRFPLAPMPFLPWMTEEDMTQWMNPHFHTKLCKICRGDKAIHPSETKGPGHAPASTTGGGSSCQPTSHSPLAVEGNESCGAVTGTSAVVTPDHTFVPEDVKLVSAFAEEPNILRRGQWLEVPRSTESKQLSPKAYAWMEEVVKRIAEYRSKGEAPRLPGWLVKEALGHLLVPSKGNDLQQLVNRCVTQIDNALPEISTLGLVESGGKIRVASLHEAPCVHVSRTVTRRYIKFLEQLRAHRAVLTDSPIKLYPHGGKPLLFSADLSAATDWIPHDLAQYFFRGLTSILEDKESNLMNTPLLRAAQSLLGPHLIRGGPHDKKETERGIHMGLGHGWIILSLINSFAAWKAGAPRDSYSVMGDDLIGFWSKKIAMRYVRTLERLQLRVNKTKSFLGRGGVFCERRVTIKSSPEGEFAEGHMLLTMAEAAGAKDGWGLSDNWAGIIQHLAR